MSCFSLHGKSIANVKTPEMFGANTSETAKPAPETELTVQIVPYVYPNGYNISCPGRGDGSISLIVSGGSPPYTFEWSNGETTQNITGLTANYYRVIVYDAGSNQVEKGITLTEPAEDNRVFATGTVYEYSNGYNVSCIGCYNGSINIEVSGGSGVYSYEWEDGATTKNRSSLSAGSYSLIVRDAGTCNYDDFVNLNFELKEPPIINWGMQGNYGTSPNTHFIGTKDNKDFVFRTNNSERLRITADGNLGIGTSIPTEKLTVSGNGKFTENLSVGKNVRISDSLQIDSLAGEGFKFDSLSNKSYKLVFVDEEGKLTTKIEYTGIERPPMCLTEYSIPWLLGGNFLPVIDGTDYNFIGTCTRYPFRIFTDANERMRITEDGFVGISTYYPRQKLEVHNGSILVSGENSGVFFHQAWGYTPPNPTTGNHGNYGIEYLPPDVINDNKGGLNFWRPSGNNFNAQAENFILHLADNGNVGIGTGFPIAKFHIDHTSGDQWSYGLMIDVSDDGSDNDQQNPTKAFTIRQLDDTEIFRVWGNGVVNAKTMYAEAVKVLPSTAGIYWPDFVFDNDYKLMSLAELEQFIQLNKHLPDVPTQSQVEEEGIDVFEMNAMLLKKIEELTLYVIDLQKQVKELSE